MSTRYQSGFTIMEILVAFFISLIGLQGLIAIQSLSLGNAQGSYYRAQGITLLNDIAGRMNANPQGVSDGDYNGFSSSSAPERPDCISSTSGCSAAQIAARDLNAWATHFSNVNEMDNYASTLPNGSGTIARQEDGSFLITVNWDETRWNADLGEGADREVVQTSVNRNINILIPF